MKKLELVNADRSAMHSPLALAFDAEVKRMSIEKGIDLRETCTRLAVGTGLTERQIYNYRNGTSDIPALLIPIFCKQFESGALAMAVVAMCDEMEFDERDAFDLARFCTGTVRNMLKGGEEFLDAFDDGHIDGHELIKLKNTRSKIIRDANRLVEIAADAHARRAA